jgi:hypothetical protein
MRQIVLLQRIEHSRSTRTGAPRIRFERMQLDND